MLPWYNNPPGTTTIAARTLSSSLPGTPYSISSPVVTSWHKSPFLALISTRVLYHPLRPSSRCPSRFSAVSAPNCSSPHQSFAAVASVVSAQPDACSCHQPANRSAALYKHPPTGDCPPHGSACVSSTHANMSKRSRLTMDTFSPMHQPDEGYSEDPLNPMTNYDITSIPASLKTPADLPDWLLSNSSNLPTHLKKGMSCCDP